MYKFKLFFIACLFLTNNLFADDSLKIKFSGNQVEMNNGSLSLIFQNDKNFKLLGLAHKNKIWKLASDNSLIWQFSIEGQKGHRITVNSQNAKYSGVKEVSVKGQKSLVFNWEYPLPNQLVGKIFMTVSISHKNTLSEWSFNSDFPEIWSVEELNFPIINLAKTGHSKLIMPAGWGVEYDLATIKSARYLSLYPSSKATVQLMSIYEDKHIFYFATHDPNASIKTFSARVGEADVELSNRITTSESWNNKGRFKLPWSTSIGVDDQGWEEAILKWYRPFTFETKWGKKTINEKKYPKWLLDSDLWLTGGHTDEKEFATAEKAINYFGKETSFHWYYWFNAAFDTKYPEYLPAKKGFDSIIKLVQNRGSHMMPYINGRLWDTTTVSYQKNGGAFAAVLTKEQKPVIEIYPSKAPNAVICPASLTWTKIMVDVTEKIQNNVGADAVFFDQVASAKAFPCWNANHGHPLGGGSFWNDATREMFTKVRSVLKPGHIISTEQNAEPYLDLFDVFKMTNRPQGKEYTTIPLFSLIYSDRALLYGFYILNENNSSYRLQNALSLLWGAQLNGGRTVFVFADAMKENAHYLLNLASFRKKQHDLFYGGRFLREIKVTGDNPILSVPNWGSPSAAVRGALWMNKQGKYAALLINIDTVDHEIKLPYTKDLIKLKAGACVRVDLNENIKI